MSTDLILKSELAYRSARIQDSLRASRRVNRAHRLSRLRRPATRVD